MRITEPDRALLSFVAEHRFVLHAHAQQFLERSSAATYTRLRSLTTAGLLRKEPMFHLQPACYLITRKGLAAANSELSQPQLDPRYYDHDVGTTWLWLAARNGALGPIRGVLSERRLRSEDRRRGGPREPWAVRLLGNGPAGQPRLHYPDLLLIAGDGRRVAIELELTGKERARLEKILTGYGADPRIDRVLYLTPDRRIAHAVRASAGRLGIAELVRVQLVTAPRGPSREPARAVQRSPQITLAR